MNVQSKFDAECVWENTLLSFFAFCYRLNLDVTWSETGDRYMLKLFRDYLFHTVTENGLPWMDHAHIIQCLNKLDAGTMEKVNEINGKFHYVKKIF